MFGLTATAVASLSLEPPLILVCIDDKTIIQDQIQQAACFGLSMLSAEQEWIARRFADSTVAEKFAAVPYDTHVTGAPTIEGALAWMDCQLRDILPGGDHKIFVGEPVCGDYRKGVPLLRYESRYITLDIDRDVTDP